MRMDLGRRRFLYDAKAESYYLNRPDLINPKTFRHYPKVSVTFEMTLEVLINSALITPQN